MKRISIVAVAGIVALTVTACSSGSSNASNTTTSTVEPTSSPATSATTMTVARPLTTTTAAPTNAGCAATPRDDRPDPYGLGNAWIQMVSPARGFAVIGRTVVGTTDGRHWQVLYRAPSELSYVDAVDVNHVWAAGAHLLVGSADGGRHWTVEPTRRPVEKPHFVDARLGWATANGSLLRSDDGGRSWVAQHSPCPVDGVCFDRVDDGWLATHDAAYVTTDGGAHWNRALRATDPNATNGVALDLQCAPSNVAWMLFGGGNGAAGHQAYVGYRCPAAGNCRLVVRNNFMAPAVPGTDGPGASPGPFSAIDAHTAAFTGYTGPVSVPMSIMIVGDDGRTLGAVHKIADPTSPPAVPMGVSFTGSSRGWVVDSTATEAHILATTDGGKAWTMQYRAPV